MQPNDLLKKTQSPKVVFHKFVLLHREFGSDLFCFFEGKDTHYYFPRIDNVNDKNHSIICGNKNSVQDSYDFIKNKYPTFRTKFFVDSDFDENIEKDDLYITSGYSIENYYCSEKVLNKILKNEFFLNETDKEFKKIIQIFRKRQKEFHQATALFNLWYFTAKKKAKQQNTIVNASLNDKFPKEFITISFSKITSNYSLQDIKNKFPNAIEVTEEDLVKNRSNFFKKEPNLLFRGKYEIEFMNKFLQYIISDANSEKKILTKKTSFRIDPALILSQLSQYAETTMKLKDFLKSCA